MVRKRAAMRVLLIEDDSATAQSIELMLKSESFNVYTTDLGEEGIDLGKIYDYDIILLDLNLPDMSGFHRRLHLQAAEKTRRHGKTPRPRSLAAAHFGDVFVVRNGASAN
jgi:CheY-like chemotaxis protein